VARIVGIVGTHYCGSTFLSRLMSFGAPRIASVGEIHWLVDVPSEMTMKTWGITEWRPTCTACYIFRDGDVASCEMFEHPWRKEVTEETLYQTLAESAKCEVLFSSDKMPSIYRRFVEKDKMDGVFLFKRPEAFVASDLRHRSWIGVTFEESLNRWLSQNERRLSWCHDFCSSLAVMSYERLVAAYQEQTHTMCQRLSLPRFVVPKDVSKATDWHGICGNGDAYRRGDVFIDRRWETELTSEQKKYIMANSMVQGLYGRLLKMAL